MLLTQIVPLGLSITAMSTRTSHSVPTGVGCLASPVAAQATHLSYHQANLFNTDGHPCSKAHGITIKQSTLVEAMEDWDIKLVEAYTRLALATLEGVALIGIDSALLTSDPAFQSKMDLTLRKLDVAEQDLKDLADELVIISDELEAMHVAFEEQFKACVKLVGKSVCNQE